MSDQDEPQAGGQYRRWWLPTVAFVPLLLVTGGAVGQPVVQWDSMPTVFEEASTLVFPGAVTGADLFDEITRIVRDNFFDIDLNSVDWDAVREEHQAAYERARTDVERDASIAALLAELSTSHTGRFVPTQVEYYELLAIFEDMLRLSARMQRSKGLQYIGGGGRPNVFELPYSKYTGIGIRTKEVDGRLFVRVVYPGGAAERADVRVGDEIVSADGMPFHPIRSFSGRSGETVTLGITRDRTPSGQIEIPVTPVDIHSKKMLRSAIHASVDVVTRDGKRLGYIWMSTLAGREAYDALVAELFEAPLELDPESIDTQRGRLASVDGLVLDLRQGWGGSASWFLDLFAANRPTEVWRKRGQVWQWHRKWPKPVVVLIDEGSRSAKEILAYALREYADATLVGTRTAGAVVSGAPFLLRDDSLLVIATMDLEIDGIRLEGRGVEPDVEVPFEFAYSAGNDPQRDAALDVLYKRLTSR